jgi:hypothetical protein
MVPLVGLLVALVVAGCNLVSAEDAGLIEGGAEAGGDADDGGEPEAGVERSGRLVLVSETHELVTDRLCDLDGNGSDDNAIADLGEADAQLFVVAINSLLASALDDIVGVALHFPLVDDLSVPEIIRRPLIMYTSVDSDHPPDPTDDFSGSEPLYAKSGTFDPCGEPLYVVPSISVAGGELEILADALPLPLNQAIIEITGARLFGSIQPEGSTFEIKLCGYATVMSLGSHEGLSAEHTLLEELSAGGRAFGAPTLPGLKLDVDVDGDGIELLFLDDGDRLEYCVDGDDTVISGRDCWQDPRMADGLSLSFELSGVSARFAGREPGWEYEVEGSCEGGMPEESLFGNVTSNAPCAALEERCNPFAVTPCCEPEHRCSGAATEVVAYQCLAPCPGVGCPYPGYVGVCHPATEPYDEHVCVSHGRGLSRAAEGCEAQEHRDPCTTEYGVDGGICVSLGRDAETIYCFERCEPGPNPCAETHYCVPLVFEEGGVCVRWDRGSDG